MHPMFHTDDCWEKLEKLRRCTCPEKVTDSCASEPIVKYNPHLGEESDSGLTRISNIANTMDLMKKDEIYGFGKVLFGGRITPRKCQPDPINHPTHYGGEENPFEPIKIIEFYSLNFALGNVIKYVLRAGKKNDELEDLKKAHFYLGREIDKLNK